MLARGGSLTTLGYARTTSTTIDVTNLILEMSRIKSFSRFALPLLDWGEAWKTILPLLDSAAIKAMEVRTFPSAKAVGALKYLTDERPLGKIITIQFQRMNSLNGSALNISGGKKKISVRNFKTTRIQSHFMNPISVLDSKRFPPKVKVSFKLDRNVEVPLLG